MKTDTHPTYFPQAKVKCACGHAWTTGSTLPEIEVEICSHCHPFYTGTEKVVDTRGRIERFKKKIQKSEEATKAKLSTKPKAKRTSSNKKA